MSQLRIRTQDDLVYIGVTTDGEEPEDFNLSMKWYGPFESADEQRKFMLGFIEDAPIDEEHKAKYRETISAWRRFDEPGVGAPVAEESPR